MGSVVNATFDEVLNGLGNTAVDALKLSIADAWDAFTPEERVAATRLLFSIARCHLLSLAGKDVTSYQGVLEAAFLQWKAVGSQVAASTIHQVATDVFGYAGAFAGSAAAAVLGKALAAAA